MELGQCPRSLISSVRSASSPANLSKWPCRLVLCSTVASNKSNSHTWKSRSNNSRYQGAVLISRPCKDRQFQAAQTTPSLHTHKNLHSLAKLSVRNASYLKPESWPHLRSKFQEVRPSVANDSVILEFLKWTNVSSKMVLIKSQTPNFHDSDLYLNTIGTTRCIKWHFCKSTCRTWCLNWLDCEH